MHLKRGRKKKHIFVPEINTHIQWASFVSNIFKIHKIGPYLYISSYPYLVGIFVKFLTRRHPIRKLQKGQKKESKKKSE